MYHPAILEATRAGLEPFRVPPPQTLSQWAEQHFYLSAESSYQEQSWVAYPFQRELMDVISNDEVEEIVLQKAARMGFTKVLVAALAYFAAHKRRNQCIWQPTDEDRDDFVKDEIDPMLRDVQAMQRVFPQRAARSKDNTLRQKRFLGSTLHMRGGNAAKNYRRISVDNAFIDEADALPRDIGKSKKDREGSPRLLAKKRTEGATFPKLVIGSSPKVRGQSLVEEARLACAMQVEYFIRCPHCQEEHTLSYAKDAPFGLKWTFGTDQADVRHVCPCCGAAITQAEYLEHWEGRWLDRRTGHWIAPGGVFRNAAGDVIDAPASVGFLIWTAYSPQATWAGIAKELEEGWGEHERGRSEALKTVTNTTLGQTWAEVTEGVEPDQLERRSQAGSYALGTVPRGALVLVTGVDYQDDRWEFVTWGLGRGEQMWLIDYAVRAGDPSLEAEWETHLDEYRARRFPREGGGSVPISAMAIDTQGHQTHQAYNYCRLRSYSRVYAVRGSPADGKPIRSSPTAQDVNWRGRVLRNGVMLYHVGTDTAKDLLHARLRIQRPGPGYVNLPTGVPTVFFEHLAAERRILQRTATGERYRWTKVALRNEALDCTVYALFAADAVGIPTHEEFMWQQLERQAEAEAKRAIAAAAAAPSGARTQAALLRPTPAPRPALRRSPYASEEWSSRL